MSYIGIPPFGQTVRTITNVTATAGQTTFNITGGYVVGYVDVFLNGVLLAPADITATDGLTVVLATGAALNDEFQAVAYQPVSMVDVVKKTGDTMSAPLALPDGSASAPALTNDGDPNTGIFFPAADAVAAATGGAERLRIDSSGNVGIGTSSPAAPLTVQGASSDGVAIFRDTTSLAAGTGGSIRFEGQTTTAGAYTTGLGVIVGAKENATSGNTASYMAFQTRANGVALAERMRITSAGGISFGSSGTAYGTTGQVLTSQGNAAPIWATVNAGTPTTDPPYDTGTNATWTKPASANWVMIEIWGGGGSGGKGVASGPAGGGGGGAYNSFVFKFSDLAGDVTYTVGAGGLSQTTGSTKGNSGGNTSVSLANFASSGVTKTLTTYGGGGGRYASNGGAGGGGGGQMGAGRDNDVGLVSGNGVNNYPSSNGGMPWTQAPWSDGACSPTYYLFPAYNGGGSGGAQGSTSSSLYTQGSESYFGGGGGGAGVDGTPGSTTGNRGGNSVYGGAGGGGAGNATRAGDGGTSTFGGNGGAGAFDANNGTAGTVPGGGGGGTEGGNSGAGAGGRVRFTYW